MRVSFSARQEAESSFLDHCGGVPLDLKEPHLAPGLISIVKDVIGEGPLHETRGGTLTVDFAAKSRLPNF